jgi:CRISPR-associated endonuclease Cas3-HD
VSSLIVFLAAAHDIGKVNPGFQIQIERFRSGLQSNGFIAPGRTVCAPHGLITAHTLQRWLEQVHMVPPEIARSLASVVGGHHGVLPPPEKWRSFSAPELGGPAWSDARNSILAHLEEGLSTRFPRMSRLPHAAAMTIAGLISV